MPSEKSRYLNKRCGKLSPLDFDKLVSHIPKLGIERMATILWMAAERNEILRKALTVAIGLQLVNGNVEKAKVFIDYALDFNDHVSYKKDGHGLILDEIQTTLANLDFSLNKEFIIHIAQYTLEKGHEVAMNFEDDWEWTSSLMQLEEWLGKINAT